MGRETGISWTERIMRKEAILIISLVVATSIGSSVAAANSPDCQKWVMRAQHGIARRLHRHPPQKYTKDQAAAFTAWNKTKSGREYWRQRRMREHIVAMDHLALACGINMVKDGPDGSFIPSLPYLDTRFWLSSPDIPLVNPELPFLIGDEPPVYEAPSVNVTSGQPGFPIPPVFYVGGGSPRTPIPPIVMHPSKPKPPGSPSNPPAVPEPDTLFLFATGLLGLALFVKGNRWQSLPVPPEVKK